MFYVGIYKIKCFKYVLKLLRIAMLINKKAGMVLGEKKGRGSVCLSFCFRNRRLLLLLQAEILSPYSENRALGWLAGSTFLPCLASTRMDATQTYRHYPKSMGLQWKRDIGWTMWTRPWGKRLVLKVWRQFVILEINRQVWAAVEWIWPGFSHSLFQNTPIFRWSSHCLSSISPPLIWGEKIYNFWI